MGDLDSLSLSASDRDFTPEVTRIIRGVMVIRYPMPQVDLAPPRVLWLTVSPDQQDVVRSTGFAAYVSWVALGGDEDVPAPPSWFNEHPSEEAAIAFAESFGGEPVTP